MELLIILIIAISLSMDAFSLSLTFGTLQLNKKYMIIMSLFVGCFHFFMPLIGLYFGNIITKYIDPNIVSCIVFLFIGVSMIINSFKKEENIKLFSFLEIILFAFAVSIDSFSLGIGLNHFTNNYLLSSVTFCISSFLFTNLGLLLGRKIGNYFGKASTILGGLILSSIGIICLFH